MRHCYVLSLSVLLLTLAGCTPLVQIIYTAPKSNNIKDAATQYTYENDTVKVVYSFWEASGVMAFTIENKWEKPIYIDWKRSAFVNSNVKLSYYTEKETTNSQGTSAFAPYLYSSIFNWNRWYPVTLGINSTNSTTIKEERVSFIPPHSVSGRTTFKILPGKFIKLGDLEKEEIPNTNAKGKILNATKEDSRIFFRNFLTYSTKESFDNEYYIDNEFYVNKVIQLPEKYLDSYANPKRFYIRGSD